MSLEVQIGWVEVLERARAQVLAAAAQVGQRQQGMRGRMGSCYQIQ